MRFHHPNPTERSIHRPASGVFWSILIASTGHLSLSARAEDQREATVGMIARIDQILLGGPELEARPLQDDSPIVLRVAGAFVHGTSGFRYDLVYSGLEAGEFDLRDYLQRKDRSSTAGLSPIPVKIR